MKKLCRVFCDLEHWFLALCVGLLLVGNPVFAITYYVCDAWEGSEEIPDWVLDDPEPFVMLKDGEDLHIQNGWNEPITITKFAWHNELIDLYRRVDSYGTTTVYYFRHSNYDPDTDERVQDPKIVLLKKMAFEPEWIITTNCYENN